MFKTKSGRDIDYYGSNFIKNISKISNEYMMINSIDELFEQLLSVWCKDTAYPICQKDYIQDNDPTYGQCAITAMLVYDIFGGEIYKIRVEGGSTHYFNKINGNYIDLTRDQFDLYDIFISYEPNELVSRDYCGKNKDTLKRFNLLVDLLEKQQDIKIERNL